MPDEEGWDGKDGILTCKGASPTAIDTRSKIAKSGKLQGAIPLVLEVLFNWGNRHLFQMLPDLVCSGSGLWSAHSSPSP
jgi:hypothetical protein